MLGEKKNLRTKNSYFQNVEEFGQPNAGYTSTYCPFK